MVSDRKQLRNRSVISETFLLQVGKKKTPNWIKETQLDDILQNKQPFHFKGIKVMKHTYVGETIISS